jgi:hypothetical protein
MHTPICDLFDSEFPIFAFTHCRDVVAAVSNAGGFGVLGAVGFSPVQLEIECRWIDEHVGSNGYGVDLVIPEKCENKGSDLDAEALEEQLAKLIPAQHREFAARHDKIHEVVDYDFVRSVIRQRIARGHNG